MTELAPVIHVVDDDQSFRSSIGRLLEASGYRVALYASGDQLLRSPPGSDPGCILLDLRMAGLDGLQLQRRLVDLQTLLPVVFLTGHGNIPASVQAMKSGAEDFLTKPVSKTTLLEAIERA
jgi:FixJ family two-component response regulator